MIRRPVFALALTLAPLPAGAFIDRTDMTCSALVESDMIASDIKVICGIPPETVARMMEAAVSGRAADYTDLLRRLDAMTPADARLTAESLAAFFQILKRDPVDPAELRNRLAEIAQRHLQLEDELEQFRVADPRIQALIDAATAALAEVPPDHAAARAALGEARALRRARREAAQAILDDQAREEAAIARKQAELEASLLHRQAAAALYLEAAEILPPKDTDAVWSALFDAADQYQAHGTEQGSIESLETARTLWHRAIALKTLNSDPFAWAAAANNLANALSMLGARQGDLALLEEAAALFTDALDVKDPDTAAAQRGRTLNNVGNNHYRIAAETGSRDALLAAISAYEEALEFHSRESAPLEWATTQHNLGGALRALADQSGESDLLDAAVAAYRAALQEQTRDRAPFDWALTQGNLSSLYRSRFDLAGDPADLDLAQQHLDEAVPVFRNLGATWYVAVSENAQAEIDARKGAPPQ